MPPIPNILLAALPRKAYQQLIPGLTPVKLTLGRVLYEPEAEISDVFFPSACLVSLLAPVAGHPALEVGMVGPEGMVGVQLALGIGISPVRALVQGEGLALRMSKVRFRSELLRSPSLRQALLGYVHELMGQISQTAICNRFHVVEERLARWLMMTRDRVGADEFRITHKILGSMLGVRREGITEAASAFQRRNLIRYSRGKVVILDAVGLQAACCSCYKPPSTSGATPASRARARKVS